LQGGGLKSEQGAERPPPPCPLTLTTGSPINDDSIPVSRTAQVSGHHKVSILEFIGAKDDGGSVVTNGATRRAKLQSNRHHEPTYIQLLHTYKVQRPG